MPTEETSQRKGREGGGTAGAARQDLTPQSVILTDMACIFKKKMFFVIMLMCLLYMTQFKNNILVKKVDCFARRKGSFFLPLQTALDRRARL